MASATDEIEDIRRHMAQIRRELHDDVRGVVEGAEAATDWRRYLTAYPWVTLGVALAVGYLVVPKRRRSTGEIVREVVEKAPRTAQRVVEVPESRETSRKKKGWGVMGALFGLLSPVAVRFAQGYALQYLEGWLAQHPMAGFPAMGPEPQGAQASPRREPPGSPGPQPGAGPWGGGPGPRGR